MIAIIYDENVDNVMDFEYNNFKSRYENDTNFIFNFPNVELQGNVFKRISVETTGTRYCEICGKEFKPKILKNGFISDETVCSKKCSKERTKRKNLIKYGYESHNQSPEIKEKQKTICLKRYGVEFGGSRPEALEKARKTNLERYGVENGSQSEEARKKISKALTKYVFTEEMNALLKKLYLEDNLQIQEISNAFNVSCGRIIKQISKLKLHRSGSKLISKAKTKYNITKEELEELRKLGLTHKQIIEKTGLSSGILDRKLKEFGLVDSKRSLNTNNIKYTNETWIEKAKSVHGDLYDYSLVDYKNSKTNVKIICKKCKRVFEQNPNHHLQGRGCKHCNNGKKKFLNRFPYILLKDTRTLLINGFTSMTFLTIINI